MPEAEVVQLHSMILSARVSNVAGTSMPSDLTRIMRHVRLPWRPGSRSDGPVYSLWFPQERYHWRR